MGAFADIVGNEQIKGFLERALQTGAVSHSYILNGEDGTGKMMFARAFAKALQCTGAAAGERPCNRCHSCIQAASGNQPDIVFVQHEKPGTIGIDDIRNGLVNDIQIRPYESQYKIYIVDEAEKLSVQAQNAMLKTIEEPPSYGIILLLSSNVNAFLPTIRSRCVELTVRPVSDAQEETYLRSHGVAEEQMTSILHFTKGNIGKAMKMAASDQFMEMIASLRQVLRQIHGMQTEQLIQAVALLGTYQSDIKDCLDFIELWYRDVLLFKATKDVNLLVFQEEAFELKRAAERCSYEGIELILEAIQTARRRLDANVNCELTMQLLLETMKEAER